jgi:hypothetical protein
MNPKPRIRKKQPRTTRNQKLNYRLFVGNNAEGKKALMYEITDNKGNGTGINGFDRRRLSGRHLNFMQYKKGTLMATGSSKLLYGKGKGKKARLKKGGGQVIGEIERMMRRK